MAAKGIDKRKAKMQAITANALSNIDVSFKIYIANIFLFNIYFSYDFKFSKLFRIILIYIIINN